MRRAAWRQLGGVRSQLRAARGAACAVPSSRRAWAGFTVLLDRGMDGTPASSRRGAGLGGRPPPAYWERRLSWLRTFMAGWCVHLRADQRRRAQRRQGAVEHGRICPASAVDGGWRGDAYELWARGRMRGRWCSART